jgi:hypothetical protein
MLLNNESIDKQDITKDKLARDVEVSVTEREDVRLALMNNVDSLLEVLVLFSDINLEEQILKGKEDFNSCNQVLEKKVKEIESMQNTLDFIKDVNNKSETDKNNTKSQLEEKIAMLTLSSDKLRADMNDKNVSLETMKCIVENLKEEEGSKSSLVLKEKDDLIEKLKLELTKDQEISTLS